MEETNDITPKQRKHAGGWPRKPDEVRAAVISGLLAGLDQPSIADNCQVSIQYVAKVKKNMSAELAELRASWRFDIEANLFQTVIATQQAVLAQLRVLSDEAWLQRQSAGDLAVLHGVLQDKVVRFLEAIQSAEGVEPEPGNGELVEAVGAELHPSDEAGV